VFDALLRMPFLVCDPSGRGALIYEPATTPAEEVATLDLDVLAAESAAVLAGEEGPLAATLADLAGGSGGARPKVHVGFNAQGEVSIGEGELPEGFAPWIVKFPGPQDPWDIGQWRLAPAYDLTYASGPGGEHYLDIEGEGRHPTRAHVPRLGDHHDIDARRVSAIVEDVRHAVTRWGAFSTAAGVSTISVRHIAAAHQRVWERFTA
jgi:hypothetical protein